MDIPFPGRIKELKDFFWGGGTRKKISKNFFWLAFSELVTRSLKFVLIIYVARILGATEYGKFTFAMAFASIFFVFSDLGLSQIVTREFSNDPKKEKIFPQLISLQVLLASITSFLIFASSFFITPDQGIRQLIWILGMMILAESFAGLVLSFFQARQKMEYLALAKILEALAVTLSGFYILFRNPSVFNLSLSYLFGAVLSAAVVFFLLFRGDPVCVFFYRTAVWKEYLKLSWPLALNVFFVSLYTATDSIMMGYFGQIEETGWYNAAQRVAGISLIPASLIGAAFFPALSGFFAESKDKFQKVWDFYFSSVVFFALPILFGGAALASRIISLAYEQDYSRSVLAFQILILMASISMIAAVFSQTLIIFNRQKSIFLVTLFGTVLNVVLNLIFIPKYSLYGAAWATVITFLAILVLLVWLTHKSGSVRILAKGSSFNLFSAVISSGIMYFAITDPLVSGLNVLFLIAIGFAVYLLSFLLCWIVAAFFGKKGP
jgi:O-antigen/teichoic acid export membrane protein